MVDLPLRLDPEVAGGQAIAVLRARERAMRGRMALAKPRNFHDGWGLSMAGRDLAAAYVGTGFASKSRVPLAAFAATRPCAHGGGAAASLERNACVREAFPPRDS